MAQQGNGGAQNQSSNTKSDPAEVIGKVGQVFSILSTVAGVFVGLFSLFGKNK